MIQNKKSNGQSRLDCVMVGYYDLDFQRYYDTQKEMAKYSGAYRDAKHNSVCVDGRRVTYMDLLNLSVERASGHNPNFNTFEVPSLGVNYLTSFLRRRQLAVESVSFVNFERERFAALLADRPLAVAITTTYYVDPHPIVEVVRFVREHDPETTIIIGGPHIYNLVAHPDERMQDYLLKSIGGDVYIVDSQGEHALATTLEVLRRGRREDLKQVPNLIYRAGDGSFQRTPLARENNNLDENHVDWSLMDEQVFAHPVFLRTARSCPFECSFCNFPAMAGEHVVAALEGLERQFDYLHDRGVRSLIFIDDTFNVPLPRFKNLLRMMIERDYGFSWMSFFRCSNSDDVAFDLMEKSGCKQVFLGIESGDQGILNNMRKFAGIEKYKEGIRKLKERGIVTYASIIIGFPGETAQTVRNTLEFLEETQPDYYNIQLYYHDVRTPIHEQREKYNIQGAGYSWQHSTMGWEEAADWVDLAFKSVQGSVPVTLYGFSVWAMPYLISKGIRQDQIREFGVHARELLVKGFDDIEANFEPQRERLADIFRPTA